MKKLIMLIAMAVSLSMLTGCFSFLLGGTDNNSKKPNQYTEPRQNTISDDGLVEIMPPREGITGRPLDPITNPAAFPIDYSSEYLRHLTQSAFLDGKMIGLNPYLIGETEVTYKLWRKVYNWAIEHGYKFTQAGRAGSSVIRNTANMPLPEDREYENYPVMYINWIDCIVWCNAYTEMETNAEDQCVYRVSSNDRVVKDATSTKTEYRYLYADTTKKGYRLPSQYEWEYAARWQKDNSNNNAVRYGNTWLTKLNSASGADKPIGCKGFDLPSGETWESLRDETNRVAVYKWWWDGSKHRYQGVYSAAAVKTKDPNDSGLYDMSGNALEWIFNLHPFNEIDPTRWLNYGTVARGDDWCSLIRLRWCNLPHTLYGISTDYIFYKPNDRIDYAGFRLCRSR